MTVRRLVLLFLALAFLAGCGLATGPSNEIPDQQERDRKAEGSIFGEDGLTFGGDKGSDSGGAGLGVNGFLWRASLDTISFFPLSQADPFGGVIITDWYTPPETPNTRFKLNVFILGRQLRADGLRVSVFKQEHIQGSPVWSDVPVSNETVRSLENAILAKARELRVAAISQPE
ncbi:DUF3576 domain-containing protein [Hwanghaeella grinnelliae]|uniref:DUF3576 domain-containing protein n=1 Tax=Hwanghaeella grinnelliae TaxID=2500179 RepID=A0A3S2W4G3_9PROT|nr:DUF3576 domain-containing protein [Hwanghaeella grinnelliae]RVU36249.1 DUF3576 domain-containing protein [Hwanghaeella grinnelliae]